MDHPVQSKGVNVTCRILQVLVHLYDVSLMFLHEYVHLSIGELEDLHSTSYDLVDPYPAFNDVVDLYSTFHNVLDL